MSEQTDGGDDRPGAGGVTDEEIARRAYRISQGEDAGSDEENRRRAERELRGEPTQDSQA